MTAPTDLGATREDLIITQAVLSVLGAVCIETCPDEFARLLPDPLPRLAANFRIDAFSAGKAIVKANCTRVFAFSLVRARFDGPEDVESAAALLRECRREEILRDHEARTVELLRRNAERTARELQTVGAL